jgi:hypothetical protein
MINVSKGMVCRHHSGRIYTVLEIANATNPSEEFPRTVVYIGANGNIWAREEQSFLKKFTMKFDGHQTEE